MGSIVVSVRGLIVIIIIIITIIIITISMIRLNLRILHTRTSNHGKTSLPNLGEEFYVRKKKNWMETFI